ncbi:MAG: hypothetical protein ACOX7K_04160 [Oscillospiraceae bacterium]|jgi:hypothetical protein
MSHTVKTYLAALLLRCGMFFFFLYTCFHAPDQLEAQLYHITWRPNVINVFWLILLLTMIRRFFPSNSENLGHQKQFSACFDPTDIDSSNGFSFDLLTHSIQECNHGIVWIAVLWCLGNGLIFLLYASGYFDVRILLLLSAGYAVGDIVCILFYCPFQQIWMHNRCCTTCRIYNWDFMMMCTPLLVIRSFYTWTLCAVAAAVLIRWEVTFLHHPERFLLSTNRNLDCQHCTSQLCQLKRKR